MYDDSTGMLYLNARFYDPQTGRFISRDTYRGVPDNAGTWHLYAYCANNPVNYVDPSGHYYTAVRLGYNLYRVARAAAVAGTIISSGGTLLIVIAVSGVAWYAGSKMAKVTTKPATKKGKRVKSTAKKKKTKKSNKEKANDVPTWVKNYKQKPGENGKHFADRVCNDCYGRNNYKKGPGTEYNRIKKWGDRRG